MPLARKFSSVFKKKPGQGAVQIEVAPSIIEEEDYEFRLAVQESLKHQQGSTQTSQVEQLKTQLAFEQQQRVNQTRKLAQENAELRDIIASLQAQEQTAANGISQTVADLKQQLGAARQTIDSLRASTDTLKSEKDTLARTIRGLEEIDKNRQATIKDLDERLTLSNNLHGGDESERERVSSALLRENYSLKTQLQEQNARFDRYQADVSARWIEMQNHRTGLETLVTNEKKAREDAEKALNVLQANLDNVSTEVEGLKRSQSHLQALFGSGTSPRIILMLMVLRAKYRLSGATESSTRFRQTGAVQHLSVQCLDVSLSTSEVGNFVESLCRGPEASRFYRSLSLKLCSLCEVPKFVPLSSGAAESQRITEFPAAFSQTPCCSAPVCSACLPGAISNAVRYDWWHNLDSPHWIKCPIAACENLLGIRNGGELENLLRKIGHPDVDLQLQMFEKATILRSALQGLDSKPTPEALTVTSNLHKRLMQRNRMFDFFDSRFNSTIPDESGRMPPFNPGNILQAEVDAGDLQIPIFTRFFKRRTAPKECSICADVLYDLDFGSDEQWMEACDGFHGAWMWNVLLFPTRLSLDCDHDPDACKGCFSTHITTQLDANGVNGCDRLSCPLCNRTFSHHEVKLYATKETFQKYDKLRLRKLLSAEPNFRWCLGPNCDNGQLYDDTEFLDPHIICEECEFESCFTHNVPWHEGQSCDQYESQRAHGDPDFAQTQEWIREHSKPCPGCGANVQKDAGCFHMTCRACRHEFCWECLANWDAIHPSAGQYSAQAHNQGCWFRTGNIQPTSIQGNDLQEALRRRRNA